MELCYSVGDGRKSGRFSSTVIVLDDLNRINVVQALIGSFRRRILHFAAIMLITIVRYEIGSSTSPSVFRSGFGCSLHRISLTL